NGSAEIIITLCQMGDDVTHTHLSRGWLVAVLVGGKLFGSRDQIFGGITRVVPKRIRHGVALLCCSHFRQQHQRGGKGCGVNADLHRSSSSEGDLNTARRVDCCPEACGREASLLPCAE